MQHPRKIIFSIIAMFLFINFFSGCIIDDLFGSNSTSFSLDSWQIYDHQGFPCLSLVFTCSDRVTVNLYSSSDVLLDSDSFLEIKNKEAFFCLASYGETVSAGDYQLKVLDKNDDQIYKKVFSFSGLNNTVLSCEQKWWKHDLNADDYSLIGLNLNFMNNGDTPVYPYNVNVFIDSSTLQGVIIPEVVLPGETAELNCFVYKPGKINDAVFSLNVENSYGTVLAAGSFSTVVEDIVNYEEFSWNYKNSPRNVKIPMLNFYYQYYSDIERYQNDDYCLYIYDLLDDPYIDMIVKNCIMSDFTSDNDVEIINYVASFVQSLDYKKDSDIDDSYEYPRYPIETLFNNGGDCEDKAIITACMLDNLGYSVSLIRLPGHMAVGVNLSEDSLPTYDYYVYDYYFLETTTEGKTVGFIPKEHVSSSEIDVFNVSYRGLLTHHWEDNSLTIYKNTDIGDYIKVIVYVENIGVKTDSNVKVEGVFYTNSGLEFNAESEIISSIKPGMKDKVILTVNVPEGRTTWFKTRVYINDEVVDIRESSSTFPV